MPKLVQQAIDDLTTQFTVTIDRGDYEHKLNDELQKYRRKAHLKGFRPGQAPMGTIRKMVGKEFLAQVIYDALNKEVQQHLSEMQGKYVGEPIPAEDQEPVEFNLNQLEDYEFKFDLGLVPEFELKGTGDGHVFTKYTVISDEAELDKQVETLLKRSSPSVTVDGPAVDNDLLTLEVAELEGDAPKAGGVTATFKLLIGDALTDAARKSLIGIHKGDKITFNILEVEKDTSLNSIRRNWLGLTPEDEVEFDPMFEAVITEISRVEFVTELTQEELDQYFGADKVHNMEEAREEFRKIEAIQGDRLSKELLHLEIKDYFLEQNDFPLPADFILRWLIANNTKSNPKQIKNYLPLFLKNLRWRLISRRVADQHEIKLDEAAFREQIRDKYSAMFGGREMSDQIVDYFFQSTLDDEDKWNALVSETLEQKVMETIASGDIQVDEKKVNLEELYEVYGAKKEQLEIEEKTAAYAAEEEE